MMSLSCCVGQEASDQLQKADSDAAHAIIADEHGACADDGHRFISAAAERVRKITSALELTPDRQPPRSRPADGERAGSDAPSPSASRSLQNRTMLRRAAAVAAGGLFLASRRAHSIGAPSAPKQAASLDDCADPVGTHISPADPRSSQNCFRLDGRVALVTGGSKGLGKAMAHGLACAGCDVVISARSEAELSATAKEIAASCPGERIEYVVCDLSDRAQAEKLAAEVQSRMGRCDILVNNAGVSRAEGTFHGADLPIKPMDMEKHWDFTVATNLSSAVTLQNALAPGMVERKWGRIVNISSIGGLGSAEGRASYSATKAGDRDHQHRGARARPTGVTVNCARPAHSSPICRRRRLGRAARALAGVAGRVRRVKRWAQPEELVEPAAARAA